MDHVHAQSGSAALPESTASVLRNTYLLLGMMLGFAAVTAGINVVYQLPHPGILITLVGFYGLLFAIHKTQRSAACLVFAFALTGFMGYTLGPIISAYVSSGAGSTVTSALAMTAAAFIGLSAVALVTRKDFSGLSSFLVAGFVVLLVAMVVNLFMEMPALQLAISAGFALFASAAILYETSAIVHGGERNYVMAAVGLFVSIYNLFVSLLNLLGVFSSD